MGLYTYGVVRADDRPPAGESGGGGAPVRRLAHRGLAAVVSDVGDDTLADPQARQLRRDLAAHADVLRRLADRTVVLPFRFGVVFPDPAAVAREFLEPHHDALAADLRRLAGAAEVTLTAAYVEDAVLGEIVRERPDLRPRRPTLDARIAVGEHVAAAVGQK